MTKAVVVGNANLDVLCSPVDEVPRFDSISFSRSSVGPGGCGSNVAIGLRALQVETTLAACIGTDQAAGMLVDAWKNAGLDLRYLRQEPADQTGVSVGLIDSAAQPRFIHCTGANARLTTEQLDIADMFAWGARYLHVAGYFVLPGLADASFAEKLEQARRLGMEVSLDVVFSPQMDDPSPLWACLPHLSVLMCNDYEGFRLTGSDDPPSAARRLRESGAQSVIIKLGEKGCWLDSEEFSGLVETEPLQAVDTSGAGDAFAAGFAAARLSGSGLRDACRQGNIAGGRMVGSLGTVAGWLAQGSTAQYGQYGHDSPAG